MAKNANRFDRSWVTISRHNLRHNLSVFRELLGNSVVPIWTVKANAYGHRIELLTREISKTIRPDRGEWFGVDSLDEAISLRKNGIKAPIIVLGYVPLSRLGELVALKVRLLVSDIDTMRSLKKIRGSKSIRIHLKIDTGTTRQGMMPEQVLAAAKDLRRNGFILEGIATHFANIEDDTKTEYAKIQRERFEACIYQLVGNGFDVPMRHAACTAAAMVYPEALFSASRIGIGLYGVDPSELTAKTFKRRHPDLALRPVLSWFSRVALVKTVPQGTPIGYGLTELTKRKTKIVIMPIGYADGFDRHLSSAGHVLINGKKCKVLGRVCMNMTIVDGTDAGMVKQDDLITIIGNDGRHSNTALELADAADTISYEIVARISPLIPRYVV